MIHKLADKLKLISINTPMVQMASFGDISLYNNKPTIKYPYVNIDVVNSQKVSGIKNYTIRFYVCDRNEPYVAYNKAETILDSIMNNIDVDVENYTTNYFNLDFQDDVNGVWCDATIQMRLELDCSNYIPEDESEYILQENGDLIKIG